MAAGERRLPALARLFSSSSGRARIAAPLLGGTAIALLSATAASADPAPTATDPNAGLHCQQIGNALGGLTGYLTAMPIQGIAWVLKFLAVHTNEGTSVTVNEPNGWFTHAYSMMIQVGLWVLLPVLMIAIIQATAKGSLRQLLRSVLVFLPISILGAVVAVELVQLLLNLTDDMSNIFLALIERDAANFFSGISNGFAGAASSGQAIGLTWILALLMTAALFSTLIVLILREGSIYIATMLLPIGFAVLVWPATSKILRRLVEFLFAIILSKLVIVAAMSMAIASVTAQAGFTPAAAALNPDGTQLAQPTAAQTPSKNDDPCAAAAGTTQQAGATAPPNQKQFSWEWVGSTLAAIVMLGISSFSPSMIKGVVAHAGVGGDVASIVTQHLTRHSAQGIILFYGRAKGMHQAAKTIGSNWGPGGQVHQYKSQAKAYKKATKVLWAAGFNPPPPPPPPP